MVVSGPQKACISSAQSHNLKIALRILRIRNVHANLKIVLYICAFLGIPAQSQVRKISVACTTE